MIDRDGNGIDDREDLYALACAAMDARGLQHRFPEEVTRELLARREEGAARGARDLTGLPWSSIDNVDSRDLDQVECAERHDGFTRVLVGIAEVSIFATPGSAIESVAAHNTTTVYTAGGTFPMLPPALSEDRTSLLEDGPRLAMVTAIDITDDGEITQSEHFPAVVQNRCRLDYNSVSAWLDGGDAPPALADAPPMQRQVHLQDRAARALRARRVARGALMLSTPEPTFLRDADGNLVDIVTRGPTRAGQLVEDLMIAVNEAVARFLEAKGYPSLRRVVTPPSRWARMVEFAASWGWALPSTPSSVGLSRFLDEARARHPEHAEELTVSVLKLIGRGVYVAKAPGEPSPGHFGLAVHDYAHSTAPNRRYPDVVTQRLLHAAWKGDAPPVTLDALTEIAARCVSQGAMARKVERQVEKSAASLFLAGRVGEFFEAVVAGVNDRGTWVRALRPAVEGRLVEGERGLDIGMHVRVRLVRCDVREGHIDFVRDLTS